MSQRLATFLISPLLLTVATITAIPDASADVNMMEASFQTSFIDLDLAGLKISRRYNSRSNFVGIFGFGWCSTFDAHLEFSTTPQGKALAGVKECGHLVNLGLGAQDIKYTNDGYVQQLTTGLVRTFSLESGELISLSTKSGPEVKVLRSRPGAGPRTRLPRDAALGEGLKMRLEYDDYNETVVALETSNGKRLEFTYSPSRDLLSAKNAWANTYHFGYDSLHNLTRIDYPDHTSENMTYDSDLDRLLRFDGRDRVCTETYTYQFGEKDNGTTRTQTSTSKLACNGRIKRIVRFDFTYSRKAKGSWTLSNLKLTRGPK